MHRWRFGSNMMSELIDSQLPSNARPMSSPLAFIIGEPELPPVMSLLLRKQVAMRPSFIAYCPKSLE